LPNLTIYTLYDLRTFYGDLLQCFSLLDVLGMNCYHSGEKGEK